jgi:hypothetical protein
MANAPNITTSGGIFLRVQIFLAAGGGEKRNVWIVSRGGRVMPNRESSLEGRIDEVTTQLKVLAARVEVLEARLDGTAIVSSPVEAKGRPAVEIPDEASEVVLAWVGKASLLQRLSVLCFLLVVALILRTVTDSEILDKGVGSVLGMLYAAVLIAWGWRLYRQESPLSPVFSVCGALLLFSIVVETHEHFESLPTAPAYILLTLAGAAMAYTSHRFKVALPVFVGTLGMSVAGVALDFPNPIFPYLFVLLLAANVLGTFATRLQRCSWLRWLLLAVTMFMLLVWGFRLGIYLNKLPSRQLPFSVAGFFPTVFFFGLAYLSIAVAGILGRITERVARFDCALPTINAAWTYTVARYVVNSGLGDKTTLGIVGVLAALSHIAIAFRLSRRNLPGAPGTNSLAMAGAVLLVMALPMAIGSSFVSLAVFSALAFGMCVLSCRWHSGGMRLTSYLLQFYACGGLALQLQTSEAASASFLGAAASGALACIALWHYLWARGNPPPTESLVFGRFDKKDRSVALLLVASLVGGFFTLRVGIYQLLTQLVAGGGVEAAFGSAQTVLINISAALLISYAYVRRDKQVRNVAILVTVFGAGKVFLLDLFGMRGLPIVASLLSFGVTALIESFALSRWQKGDVPQVADCSGEDATLVRGGPEEVRTVQ